MKKNRFMLLALLLVASMLAGLLSGCGGAAASAVTDAAASAAEAAEETVQDAEEAVEAGAEDAEEAVEETIDEALPEEGEEAEEAESTEEGEPAAEAEDGEVVLEYVELPVSEEELHYSCWMPVAPFMDLIGVSLDQFSEQINMVRLINETTNVYIDFQAVAGGFGEDEKFNLMIAANDYCDIIGISSNYSTGTEGAIDDEVIIDIRDDLEEYAPNYMNLLKSNQKAYLNMLTDSGKMGCIAQLLKKAGTENMGMIIRKDWLDEAGLTGEPTTLDDMEKYLQYSKDTYGAYAYLQYGGQDTDWASAFNVNPGGFMVKDGKVVHAYTTQEYRDYLTQMNDWYKKGFFNDDFYNDTDITTVRYDMANDLCSFVDYSAAGISDIYDMNPANDKMELMAIHYPKAPGVEDIHVGFDSALIKNADTWAITTACDDPIPLLQLVNWLYSEEGQFIYNWGEEGVSFEYGPDREPHWTDLIINNPDGLSYMFATYKYASGQATTFFPGVFDMEKGFYDPRPGQLEALDTLSELTDGAWIIDRGVQIPLDLQTENASISTEMSTYADGEILKFILGDRSMDTYDDFLATVESMGLDRLTEIQQIAYDTYMEKLG